MTKKIEEESLQVISSTEGTDFKEDPLPINRLLWNKCKVQAVQKHILVPKATGKYFHFNNESKVVNAE